MRDTVGCRACRRGCSIYPLRVEGLRDKVERGGVSEMGVESGDCEGRLKMWIELLSRVWVVRMY